MSAQKSFTLGLVFLSLGVLTVAWFTWCVETDFSITWSSEPERIWNSLIAKHDWSDLSLTAFACLFVSLGIYRCVDGMLWRSGK